MVGIRALRKGRKGEHITRQGLAVPLPLALPSPCLFEPCRPKTTSGGEARYVYVGVPQREAPLSGEVGPRTQPCWVPKLEPVRGVSLRCKGAEEVEDSVQTGRLIK